MCSWSKIGTGSRSLRERTRWGPYLPRVSKQEHVECGGRVEDQLLSKMPPRLTTLLEPQAVASMKTIAGIVELPRPLVLSVLTTGPR